MPNEYSVEIHNYLSREIEKAEKERNSGSCDQHYLDGKLSELYWIREYLAEKIDLKDFKYY